MEISSDRPEPSCLLSCALPSLSLSLLPSVAGTYIVYFNMGGPRGGRAVSSSRSFPYRLSTHPFLMLNNFMLNPRRVKQKPFTVQKTFQNKKRFWGIHLLPTPLPQKTNAQTKLYFIDKIQVSLVIGGSKRFFEIMNVSK